MQLDQTHSELHSQNVHRTQKRLSPVLQGMTRVVRFTRSGTFHWLVFANIHGDWFEGSFSLIYYYIRDSCGFFVYQDMIWFLRLYHIHTMEIFTM